jgi:perosamine synthetase
MFEYELQSIRSLFPDKRELFLHEPSIGNLEEEYVRNCVRSTYVSYVGEYSTKFESEIKDYLGIDYCICTSSGTTALHLALMVAGVKNNDEVITQALTFVGTVNPILFCGAYPIFLDVSPKTLGMCPDSLKSFLELNCYFDPLLNATINKTTGRTIKACVPVHTLGFICEIEKIVSICKEYNIRVIEDAAESLGSTKNGIHAGTFADMGVLSFNGNKIITTGGGGALVTHSNEYASLSRHLSTTAKVPHPWEFIHNQMGYNYRMPSLNAALGCAQIQKIETLLQQKRRLADKYRKIFSDSTYCEFMEEPDQVRSNFWLCSVSVKDQNRDAFIKEMHGNMVFVRPLWKLMPDLEFLKNFQSVALDNSRHFASQVVNLPSSAGAQV